MSGFALTPQSRPCNTLHLIGRWQQQQRVMLQTYYFSCSERGGFQIVGLNLDDDFLHRI